MIVQEYQLDLSPLANTIPRAGDLVVSGNFMTGLISSVQHLGDQYRATIVLFEPTDMVSKVTLRPDFKVLRASVPPDEIVETVCRLRQEHSYLDAALTRLKETVLAMPAN